MIRWTRYLLERWVLRGSPALVVMLIVVLALIAVGGAICAHLLSDHFAHFGDALWWAILRISDPGYLSDDIPDIEIRILSVVLSVLGMAVTVGGIVTIVTQALNARIAHLASAVTPVPFTDHIVIIGWTDRTPQLLRELIISCNSRIVVLIESVGPEEHRRLLRALPNSKHLERIVLRRGTPTRRADLHRASCTTARCILIPAGADAVGGDPEAGPRDLKALLALRAVFEASDRASPLVILEVIDRSLLPLVEGALPGVRALHSDRVLARTLRLGLQAPALLSVAVDLARPHRGWKLEAHPGQLFLGKSLSEVSVQDEQSHLLGITRSVQGDSILLTHSEERVRRDDGVLFLDAPAISPGGSQSPSAEEVDALIKPPLKHVLVLGWSEVLPDLLAQFCIEGPNRYKVDIMCTRKLKAQQRAIAELTEAGDKVDLSLISLRHFVADPVQLDAVNDLELSSYDHFVILAERKTSAEASDARTLATALALHRGESSMRPHATIVAEFLETDEIDLLPRLEGLVTPSLIAEVLASLALAPQSHDTLERTLLLKSTYLLRAVPYPDPCDWNHRELESQMRDRGVPLLQLVQLPHTKGGKKTLLVAEPAYRAPAKPS